MNTSPSAPSHLTVAIVGVGLIGGSIASALMRAGGVRVVGVGRDAQRLKAACDRGLLHASTTDLAAAGREADLVVFCTPVDRIVAGVREAAVSCRPGTLLTDAGSTKGMLCRALESGLPEGVEFLGSHPMAGSEKQGFEHASATLFDGRLCLITPVARSTASAKEKLRRFWERLGARVCEMSPEEHDRAVAEASHLPHLLAATIASTLQPAHRHVAASGFRDTTRIAGGDPDLWTAILLENAEAVLSSLKTQQRLAREFAEALAQGDASTVRRLLADGQEARKAVLADGPHPVCRE